MSSTDHGASGNVGRASATNSSVHQTPHRTPNFAGNDTSRKVSFLPPSNRQMVVFQHFSSPFDALTCTLRLRTRSRMCVGHSDTHSIPLQTQKGRKPLSEASVEVNC
ncbi:hypothetical protein TNIN_210741 [Trichonephila inaurata madagascariensis]|uniref:Uncharacterized protein n=1 Tax=Trichonephila inaurata madagascariensis TaxID=2747483 RepID=A0A8X6YN79_9ARAC|nr:hypothetical protein TNIN_210741 [Trichonephila inaurata madagascariensis]